MAMNKWVKAIIAAAAGGVLTILAALATGWFDFAAGKNFLFPGLEARARGAQG